MAAELEKTREQKQGQLQQELEAVKQHLAKLQRIQFAVSSEKRKKSAKPKKERKKRSRSGACFQPDLAVQEQWFELDEADKICPGCGDPLAEMGACTEDSELIDPLARQVRKMGREGLRIDTQTLWDQLDVLAEHLEPTYLGI